MKTQVNFDKVLHSATERIHDLLFALAGAHNSKYYYIAYSLADGSIQVRRQTFADAESGGEQLNACAKAHLDAFKVNASAHVVGFTMAAHSHDGSWFCMSTNAVLCSMISRFVPYLNDDGCLDYHGFNVDPKADIEAVAQLVQATSDVWRIAFDSGAAILDEDAIAQSMDEIDMAEAVEFVNGLGK